MGRLVASLHLQMLVSELRLDCSPHVNTLLSHSKQIEAGEDHGPKERQRT